MPKSVVPQCMPIILVYIGLCIKKKVVDYVSFTDLALNCIAFMKTSQNAVLF